MPFEVVKQTQEMQTEREERVKEFTLLRPSRTASPQGQFNIQKTI